MRILAGDVGGTNTRIIFAEVIDNHRHILAEKNYRSADFAGLIQLLDVFLTEYNITIQIDAVCFAVAGPVESGVAAVTNLPWVISEAQLAQRLHTSRVKLINDFVAAAHGIAELDATDSLLLQQGMMDDAKPWRADAAVIGAGTGLGVAHLVWLNNRYQIFSSETGHTGFAPANILQSELLIWLQKSHSHVSLEMLLSGKGLATIYYFLRDVKGVVASLVINEAMQNTDPAQFITEHGLLEDDDLCVKTLAMFIDIYAAAASNVVLHYYPLGTLYIAGGIAPKIKARMQQQDFIDGFLNKGLMSSNMKKITIKLITQEKVGLYGALSFGCALIRQV